MAGRWFLDSHVPKCETLVRLIFRSSDKPVLGALNMSVYSKAGFFVLRPFFGRFSREKIGKKRGFPATCRKFLDKGCEKLDQGVDQFEVLADQGLDLLRR